MLWYFIFIYLTANQNQDSFKPFTAFKFSYFIQTDIKLTPLLESVSEGGTAIVGGGGDLNTKVSSVNNVAGIHPLRGRNDNDERFAAPTALSLVHIVQAKSLP